MYKLRIWQGPGKDHFVKLSPDKEDWGLVEGVEDGSELTIEWVQKNLGTIHEVFFPERIEILQVREHADGWNC